MTEKEKAETYVRNKIPKLSELSFGCEVLGGAFSKPMIYHYWGLDTSPYGRGDDGHHLIYKDNRGSYFTTDTDFEIIGHPIQLQHWLRVLGNLGSPVESYVLENGLFETEVNYEQKVYFNLTTGQPATEADYQAFNQIVGI